MTISETVTQSNPNHSHRTLVAHDAIEVRLDSLLMGALRVFLRKHEQIRPEAMLPVLFRLAALFAMATLGMEPEDVGQFSTLAGEQCRPEVAAFREFMRKRGQT